MAEMSTDFAGKACFVPEHLTEGHEERAGSATFPDLLSVDMLQQIQDTFAMANDVASVIVHPDGQEITRPSNSCKFCREIVRATEEGRSSCWRFYSRLNQESGDTPVIQCDLCGLTTARVTIRAGGQCIAYWIIGQIRGDSFQPDSAQQYAEKNGVDPARCREVVKEIPRISDRRFMLICRNLELTANQISELALQKLQLMAIQQELRESNLNLETEVKCRTRDLEEALARIDFTHNRIIQKEKITALGRLAGGIAHEINTPLGVCVTAVSHLDYLMQEFSSACLSEGPVNSLLRDLTECCNLLKENIDRSSRLIFGFRSIATESQSSSGSVFPLVECLQETASRFADRFEAGGISWTVTAAQSFLVDGDYDDFSRVVANLITNSIEHAFPSDIRRNRRISVTVEARVFQQRYQSIQIAYEDNGIGISSQLINQVFDPYVTTKSQHEGRGLGLYLVNDIVVRKLQGTVEADPIQREGTRIVITIPWSGKEKKGDRYSAGP